MVLPGAMTAAAAGKSTVKLGYIGPLTGGNSSIGLGARNAMELAILERNGDAGAKYSYELVSLDDECKPNIGIQVATKMAADRSVLGAVAHYCSAVALGTVDVYHRFGLPVIVYGAVHPDITYAHDYPEVLRIIGTLVNQNQVASKFMLSQGYRRFAVISDTTDYGKSHKEYFTKYIKEGGGEILEEFGVTADQQDFTAELTRIKSLNPQVVYFAGLTPLGVRIRAQMEKLGIKAQFEGVSGIKSEAFITGLGAELAEGCLSFLEGSPLEKLAGGDAFMKNYSARNFKNPPDTMAPFTYVAANQIMDAVEKVGPDRKKIISYLRGIKDADSLIGKVTYDEHGQNSEPYVSKYVVQDGVWLVWEDSEYASGKRSLKK
ncbi:MAG: branched-chain amino acid ABC transporter substrate-binding protein [Deltaproteobacteria bacterium]|jgi:branched-chain amino acid transport system substrate-binding protein|nr:branched-chain amino acid ABC transporter substrate-binding protein [Deltaproteobacteria bacterium]